MSNETSLPDLVEKIDHAVGKLTVIAARLNAADSHEARADGAAIDEAMLLLAGLQSVVTWEPSCRLESARDVAEQLRAMASIGPRPPAVTMLLGAAVGHILIAQEARAEAAAEPDDVARGETLALQALLIERDAYGLAEGAMALGRRLVALQHAVRR